MNYLLYILPWILLSCTDCKKPSIVDNVSPQGPAGNSVTITTDKACYKPGEDIVFTISQSVPAGTRARYRQLNDSITVMSITGNSWHWTAPAADHTGYMVDLYSVQNGVEKIYGNTAVDVSSDWSTFPRYGFLSVFSTGVNTDSVIGYLNRYHINGIQFYDWEYEHHQPLAGTPAAPAATWIDISNRQNSMATVRGFISAAHQRNMMAMSYNLCYGALNDAAADGVADEWYMYTDAAHKTKDALNLPTPLFKSNIWLMDPSNTGWQNYLAGKTNDMYAVYSFDGYHVDQVGNLNHTDYTYSGSPIGVDVSFGPFLKAMKAAAPAKRLVMNAVSQYGQQTSIATAPVDFLYTEVWPPTEAFTDLPKIIQDNTTWSGGARQTVLAAYMDYALANNTGSSGTGYFNTPGVLLADAVIFSFGGDHLELGDHMLDNEYFPNANLQVKPDLQTALVRYYDFLTAYENLLRGGGSFNSPTLTAPAFSVNAWPPQTGQVSVVGKDLGSRQVLHLINLANAANFDWRDTNGNQTVPKTYQNVNMTYAAAKPVKQVWYASPDVDGGTSKTLSFSSAGNTVSFTLPSLQYWDMVVVEYQ